MCYLFKKFIGSEIKLDAINKFLTSDYKSSYLEMTKELKILLKIKISLTKFNLKHLKLIVKNLSLIPKVKENVLKEISNHNYSSIFYEILSVKEHVNFMFDNF